MDILGLITPVLRVTNTCITFIPKPSVCLPPDVVSLRGALHAFSTEVDLLLHSSTWRTATERSNRDQPFLISLSSRCKAFLENPMWDKVAGRPLLRYGNYSRGTALKLLESIHDAWQDMTTWLSRRREPFRYTLTCHLAEIVNLNNEVNEIQPHLPIRYPENDAIAKRQLMRLYFTRCLQRCVDRVSQALQEDPTVIESCWLAMIFRGICWHALHNFDDRVVAVPPRYHDSNLPIYIC
jgi:hypothetical protein